MDDMRSVLFQLVGVKPSGPTDAAEVALALETADKQDAAIKEYGADWLVAVQFAIPGSVWAQPDFPGKFYKAQGVVGNFCYQEEDLDGKLAEPLPQFFQTWISKKGTDEAGRPKLPFDLCPKGTWPKGACYYSRCLKSGHNWRQCPLLALNVAKNPEAPLAVEDTMDIE
ncbi:MAG: hypothetical protein FRX49_04302 [Trebouxia sp. A1-2]|nr:MAG: hypothetical protein FRX49_04302 [Trebouxia sp. A1-2]